MDKHIIVDGNGDGTFKVEGMNFVGRECDAKMKGIEDILGPVIKRTDKSDIHKQRRVSVQHA